MTAETFFATIDISTDSCNIRWCTLKHYPALGNDDVHLFKIDLDQDNHTIKQLKLLLSPDELNRAKNYKYSINKKHFIIRKGMYRLILGRYLQRDAREIKFSYTDKGKPFLNGFQNQNGICFSTSSSNNTALLALTLRRNIGIDIEKKNYLVEYKEIASSFFAPSESRYILSLPKDDRADAFYFLWTTKEAYLKALALCLSLSALRTIKVPINAESNSTPFMLMTPLSKKHSYKGRHFHISKDYVATLITG